MGNVHEGWLIFIDKILDKNVSIAIWDLKALFGV